tara:strand:- start:5 stop:784 length:780 start_codon:yes stop_codon:yes gene_type:complete
MGNPLYGSNKWDDKVAKKVGDAASPDGGIFRFEDLPIVGDHGGVDTASCIHMYDDGLKLIVQNIGTQTAGTAAGPVATSAGMNYSYDGADNEGIQWCLADANAKGYWKGPQIQKYRVGSDAFYAKLTFSVADVSDTDDCLFGFRKVEAFQAAVDDYDEMAAMKLNAGDIETETIINNGGTTTTTNIDAGSNWGDGESHSFEVLVASTGAVTYKYDGSTSANAVAFSLDVGEIVTPFFYHIHAAASSSGVVLQSFEHGRQ